jgi:glycosyltransferase involved in cell wall biosynthesis
VTKLGPQRGNEILLEATARVARHVPNLRVALIYKPTYFHRRPNQKYVNASTVDADAQVAELRGRIAALGLADMVRLIEWPDDVGDYVAAADFLVAPFLSERFSSVNLLEAMARGKPLIATDLGEPREIVRDDVSGYLVAPGDVDALATRIRQLAESPALVERLGRGAYAEGQRHSAPAYARALEQTYAELAMRAAPRAVPPLPVTAP